MYRTAMSRLKMSSHRLQIETGRCTGTNSTGEHVLTVIL